MNRKVDHKRAATAWDRKVDYAALCEMRKGEVLAYIRDGWSASYACSKAGIRWEFARDYLIQDEEFAKEHESRVKAGRLKKRAGDLV